VHPQFNRCQFGASGLQVLDMLSRVVTHSKRSGEAGGIIALDVDLPASRTCCRGRRNRKRAASPQPREKLLRVTQVLVEHRAIRALFALPIPRAAVLLVIELQVGRGRFIGARAQHRARLGVELLDEHVHFAAVDRSRNRPAVGGVVVVEASRVPPAAARPRSLDAKPRRIRIARRCRQVRRSGLRIACAAPDVGLLVNVRAFKANRVRKPCCYARMSSGMSKVLPPCAGSWR
jgi:hypothetical protein